MRTSLLLVPVLATTASLLCQRNLVIDGRNGPGTQFTDLPAAEAAAVDGDILQLNSNGGPYTAVQTSKGVTICSTGPQALIRVSTAHPMRVVGLGAGRVLALKDLLLVPIDATVAALQVLNCLGHVQIDNVEISGGRTGLDVAFATVTMREGRLLPASQTGATVVAQAATLSFVGVAAYGSSASILFGVQARPAVQLNACTAGFVDCTFRGGNGDQTTATSSAPAPGMRADFSVVELGVSAVARAQCVVVAGTARNALGAPAIVGQASFVRATPGVQLQPSGSAPPVTGVGLATAAFPTLAAYGNVEPISVFAQGLPNAPMLTLFGFVGHPFASTAFAGLFWLDPDAIVLQVGAPPPDLPQLPHGLTLAMQLANLGTQGVVLSNPAVITGF